MAQAEAAGQALPVTFSGTTREYFGIWIVNILLTVLTLGIYTPWAKVRTMRYFYGNTQLDNAPFDYLASPKAILRGWAVASLIFVAYSAVTRMVPASAPLFSIAFVVALPWIIVRAMSFRLRNTAYRNIRFGFDKDYREAIKVFIGMGILVPLTAGLIFPYFAYRQKKFYVDHTAFGQTHFKLPDMALVFYEIYMVVAIVFLALVLALSYLLPAMITPEVQAAGMNPALGDGPARPFPVGFFSIIVAGLLTAAFSYPYLRATVTNALWNHASIGGHRFESTLTTRGLTWLYFSNWLAITLSLGLLTPWTKIRKARYQAENLAMVTSGDLGSFVASADSKSESAAGEQIGEAFDVDIGL